jgi:isopenicillin-N N-acyltransferase like protein
VNGHPIRVLELAGTPHEMGTAHGAAFADEIAEYARGRVELARTGTRFDTAGISALAESMVDAHRTYAPDLMEETTALAAAAGITVGEAIVVSGYTDLLDTVRAADAGAPVEDNCTAVIVPDHRAGGAGFYAQTWDMNASATPHVVMLDIRPEGKARALVFSTVGCVGQLGMNEFGVCVGINNLTVTDGRIGVTWPFVVRKALEATSAAGALEAVMEAELAGGHNFHLFDRSGAGFSIEATATRKVVTTLDANAIVRTNHCLTLVGRSLEGDRPAQLQLSSELRLRQAVELLDGGSVGVEDLMALTRDERAICRRPEPPFDYETCGAAIMRPQTGELWACWGIPADNDYQLFRLPVSASA